MTAAAPATPGRCRRGRRSRSRSGNPAGRSRSADRLPRLAPVAALSTARWHEGGALGVLRTLRASVIRLRLPTVPATAAELRRFRPRDPALRA